MRLCFPMVLSLESPFGVTIAQSSRLKVWWNGACHLGSEVDRLWRSLATTMSNDGLASASSNGEVCVDATRGYQHHTSIGMTPPRNNGIIPIVGMQLLLVMIGRHCEEERKVSNLQDVVLRWDVSILEVWRGLRVDSRSEWSVAIERAEEILGGGWYICVLVKSWFSGLLGTGLFQYSALRQTMLLREWYP